MGVASIDSVTMQASAHGVGEGSSVDAEAGVGASRGVNVCVCVWGGSVEWSCRGGRWGGGVDFG